MDTLEKLAIKYSFSLNAVETLAKAIDAGSGQFARFNHPELGKGEWQQGDLILQNTISTEFSKQLSGLCQELSALVNDTTTRPMPPVTPPGFYWGNPPDVRPWWPRNLGNPDASSSTKDLAYAYFKDHDILLVRQHDQVITYDTRGYPINGLAIHRRNDMSSVKLHSVQHGIIDSKILRIVTPGG